MHMPHGAQAQVDALEQKGFIRRDGRADDQSRARRIIPLARIDGTRCVVNIPRAKAILRRLHAETHDERIEEALMHLGG